jgi:hypothetical protein
MSSELPFPVDAQDLDTRDPGEGVSEPELPLPDDGPRYHEEDASAALLKSTFRPFEDWNPLCCPDCRQQWMTDDALSAHWRDEHADGRWRADE